MIIPYFVFLFLAPLFADLDTGKRRCPSDSSSSDCKITSNLLYDFTAGENGALITVYQSTTMPGTFSFRVSTNGTEIYNSNQPVPTVPLDPGTYEIDMDMVGPHQVDISASTINPRCPQSSTGTCFLFAFYVSICFCQSLPVH